MSRLDQYTDEQIKEELAKRGRSVDGPLTLDQCTPNYLEAELQRRKTAKPTDILLVIDRSGSMQPIWPDTVGGVKTFIEDQRKTPGEARLTVHVFDTKHRTVCERAQLATMTLDPLAGVSPRGGTALYDAIGSGISKLEGQCYDNVIVAIVTDGEENSSSEWGDRHDPSKIGALIAAKQKVGWNFVFLGAGQDAILEAGKIGIGAAMAANYVADSVGTQKAYVGTSHAVRSARSSGHVDTSWKAGL